MIWLLLYYEDIRWNSFLYHAFIDEDLSWILKYSRFSYIILKLLTLFFRNMPNTFNEMLSSLLINIMGIYYRKNREGKQRFGLRILFQKEFYRGYKSKHSARKFTSNFNLQKERNITFFTLV